AGTGKWPTPGGWGTSGGAGAGPKNAGSNPTRRSYMHVDLGTPDFNTLNPPDPSTSRIDFDTARLGINYHF
ncbi:hypothetical protein, partial [Mesorhizobium caraganae]|uniref:hypothetical protein n=1 Tax=Mesorhizobium caraganae TaxID=483206 RepID=UPI001AEE828C